MIYKGKEQKELGECEVTMTDDKTGKVIMTGICFATDNIELFGTNGNIVSNNGMLSEKQK